MPRWSEHPAWRPPQLYSASSCLCQWSRLHAPLGCPHALTHHFIALIHNCSRPSVLYGTLGNSLNTIMMSNSLS